MCVGAINAKGGSSFSVALTITLPHKLVAKPMHRNQMFRISGIALDLFAQLGDVGVNGAGERDGVVAPHRVEELFAGHDLALVGQEVAEKPEFARRQLKVFAALRRLVAIDVDGEIAKLVDRTLRRRHPVESAAAQLRRGP